MYKSTQAHQCPTTSNHSLETPSFTYELSDPGGSDLEALQKKYPHTLIAPHLPLDIQAILDQVITYRVGKDPEACMITTDILSYVLPNHDYRFTTKGLEAVTAPIETARVSSIVEVPQYTALYGQWSTSPTMTQKEANILGASGSFYLEQEDLKVVVETATPEKLAYYRAILLNEGEIIRIDSPTSLPVSVMQIGPHYEQGYLNSTAHGGGYYLEVHNTPHLWSHLSPEGRGVLLLGKKISTHCYHLSAFTLPWGTAVYIPGGVIHCDGLLIGRVMVIYTVTAAYSTVILKKRDASLPVLEQMME